MPFKALDAVIDALSRYLRQIGDVAAASLAPRALPELCRVFPVLSRVPAFAKSMPSRPLTVDPQEVRRLAFGALKEIFVRLGDRKPLVLVIDDLQWGDADSGLLLTQLLGPPEPPRLLLVGCYRSDEADRSPLLAVLREELPRLGTVNVSTNTVGPLDDEMGRTLAASLLSSQSFNASPEIVAAIASEAGGSPFFIAELARASRASRGAHDREAPHASVAALIDARVRELPERARRVLELVAVAGGTLTRAATLRAAGLANTEDDAFELLRSVSLLRTSGLRADDLVDTYHDRIRERVVTSLPAPRARVHHLALAETLTQSAHPPADRLAIHYREAGRADEARIYALKAADQAFDAVAFDRAAVLYRDVLDLLPAGDTGARRSAMRKLGDALGGAGQGLEAANTYLEAAGGADEEQVIELERRAAYELVCCGDLDRGLDLMRVVTARFGIWMPRNAVLAYAIGQLLIFLVFLRGTKVPVARRQHPPKSLARADVVQSFGMAIAMADPLYATYLAGVGLIRGSRLGAARQLGQSVGHAICAAVFLHGSSRWIARALAVLDRVAERSGDSRVLAYRELTLSIVAFHQGRWQATYDHSMSAAAAFSAFSDASADLNIARAQTTWALYFLGRIREYTELVETLVQHAVARQNLMLRIAMMNFSPMTWLAADDPARAERELEDVVHRPSVGAFRLRPFFELLARHSIELYRSNGEALHDRMERAWRMLRRQGALHTNSVRLNMLMMRGSAALAAGVQMTVNAKKRRSLLFSAQRHAEKLRRIPIVGSGPLAKLIMAGVANQNTATKSACTLLDEAIREFDAADMRGFAAAARRQLGGLRGGDEGAKLVEEADAFFREQGVVRPDRFAAMLAPGFR